MIPNDPRYGEQWHFDWLGDIERVWNSYTGEGVSVLVYDDGVQSTHFDLDDHYDASLEFTYRGVSYDGDPSDLGTPVGSSSFGGFRFQGDTHGTAVAGLIGAENNGRGGVGVAFDVDITSFNYFGELFDEGPNLLAQSRFDMANFDVMNASIGLDYEVIDFDADYAPLAENTFASSFHDAMEFASETGRGGLGTLLLYAAGNETYTANGSYLTNNRFNMAIAATLDDGYVAGYSNYGSAVFIAAPAGSVTTDLMGDYGASSSHYRSDFGGTSAATPVATGVTALVLDANESLGWRDVQDILALSAAQIGSDFGSDGSRDEYGAWFANDATNWNGGGLTSHLSYGFGMIDAFAATRLAEVWNTLYGKTPATSANEDAIRIHAPTTGTVASNQVRTFDINVDDTIDIDSLYLSTDLMGYGLDALTIELVTPDGQAIEVLDNNRIYMDPDGPDNVHQYDYLVTGVRGMISDGTWGVRITNNTFFYDASVLDLSISFYGDTVRNATPVVHHFTDDFADLVEADGSRALISTDGAGRQWLNFAMVDQGVYADLDGGDLRFGRETVAETTAGFDNAMGGQRNDVLVGSTGDNKLYGNRGADKLFGGAGGDFLDGGVGRDTLRGGRGVDVLHGRGGHDILVGGDGKDTLKGGSGSDKLYGDRSADKLFGGGGNDWIDGGRGNDILTGGWGADTFVFKLGYGRDRILDFAAVDTIRISSALAADVDALDALDYTANGKMIFDFDSGERLAIDGISDFSEISDAFVFV